MRTRKPHPLLILALLAVLVTGCVFPGDDSGLSPPPCDCPHFEAAVASINWAPDTQLDERFSGSARNGGLFVNRTFRGPTADAEVLVDRLRRAAISAGFAVTRDEGDLIEMSSADLTVEANTFGSGDSGEGIAVRVIYDGEDSPEVAELLEPLRSALEE
jgi:hypothetical protein